MSEEMRAEIQHIERDVCRATDPMLLPRGMRGPMTAPAEDPRGGEIACVVCGYPLAEHQGDGEMVHDFRPAGDGAQPTEELRKAIARTLAEADGILWNSLSEKIGTCDHYRQRADALLAGPLAALLDAQAKVERVEALLPRIQEVMEFDMAGERYDAVMSVQQVRDHLRRALDGA